MAHTFTNLLVHVIFSSKDRLSLITPDIKPRLLAYMGGIVRTIKGIPLVINGTADHVHLLLKQPATETEFVTFLVRHGIEYDERFIWE